ncbi:LuxR C-terminal-related transcriptional regulator [Flavihumibacter profundi]|jgi:DNA-binding NarL/FixJ family response regulator|uniref:LuxR C-terminal-related transcriptional regulator n=1 Tax=Flavihumibacter profundi TaxID=2716883 RepID=UPI001CC6FDF8|nr:response regulator transcription factor [Flavihumibacter profundi]MBZ5858192.1 response regulator transcription factor [Flavihumibacter profundi]
MTRVFITDDHEMYLEGLSLLLQKQDSLEVTGTSSTALQLLSSLPDLSPDDVLLLDVNLPDMEEEELIKQIRTLRPRQKIIYLTLIRGTRYVHKLLKYQVQGYILKNASVDELLNAINIVDGGGTYFSKEIDILSDGDFRNTLTVEDKQVGEILSKREIEVLKLVCKEFSNVEIAQKLFLSVSTVETHRKNLIAKLGVQNTVGLVKFAIRNNLID